MWIVPNTLIRFIEVYSFFEMGVAIQLKFLRN